MPDYVNVEFTEDEAKVLRTYFAQRQSANCEDAIVGRRVAAKLDEAVESFDVAFEPFGC
jgi:hypothetical protein